MNKKKIILIIVLISILFLGIIFSIKFYKRDTENEVSNEIILKQTDETTDIEKQTLNEDTTDEMTENELINKNTNIVVENITEKVESKEIKQETNTSTKEVKKSESVSVKKETITSTIKDGALINGHLSSYPNFGEKYATLKISKIGVNASVYFGATDEILLKGVAHDSGSYFVGENGSTILCGHNYMNNFRRLGELKSGDVIEVHTSYGDFYYKVYDTKTILETEVDKLPIQKNQEKLMLYTCYPFNSTGYTQYRYVVYANKI